MEDTFIIHVDIGDGTYSLRIRREEEEILREAAKQLRIKMEQYRQVHPGTGTKDLLAMAALQFSVKALCLQDKNNTAPFAKKIQDLTDEMSEFLSQRKK